MTTSDAQRIERLVADLGEIVDIKANTAFVRSCAKQAIYEIARLRVDAERYRDALKEIAYAGSSVPHGMDESSFNRGQFYTCIRTAADALAATAPMRAEESK